MQITLSNELARKLEERVSASDEFDSVEAYANYVLDEVVKQTQQPEAGPEGSGEPTYTKEQEEAVKKRLEDLGYLD